METQEQKQLPAPTGRAEGKGTKFLAGVGVAALLVAAVWLGVQAVQFGSNVTSGFANAFSSIGSFFNSDSGILVEANPAIVADGESFVLSWEYADQEEEGSYTFVYECAPSVHLTSPISTNSAGVIFCNTPFDFVNENNKLELGVISTNKDVVDMQLEIRFTPNNSDTSTKTGEATVTIVDDPARIAEIAGTATSTQATSTEETIVDGDEENADSEGNATTPSTPPATTAGNPTVITGTINPVNDPNGTPDLSVRILAVGRLNGDTFIPQSGELDPADRLAVRFEIVNNGTKDTGAWNFEARLPTEPTWTFESDDQETLLPGSRVEYTLGFDDAEDDDDTGSIRIKVDPDDDIDEQSENNNVDTITIEFKN